MAENLPRPTTPAELENEDRLIRQPEVLGLLGIGATTLWKGVKEGYLPRPVKLGPRISAWKLSEIRQVIQHGAPARN